MYFLLRNVTLVYRQITIDVLKISFYCLDLLRIGLSVQKGATKKFPQKT